jgi:poly(A) polymerase
MQKEIDIPVGDRVALTEPLLRRIGALADREGLVAFVVGGFVRDHLLGAPVKDIDIVVLGDGIKFGNSVARELGNTKCVVFEQFGTAMLHFDEWKLEFVGARKESYASKSRKPAIVQGSLEEDLARRDFTLNAMAISINAKHYGNLSDPFHGRSDIQDKLLRTPLDPSSTFSDDPLRIMRVFRFAAQLGFEVDEGVMKAAHAMRERLSIVSQERISDEFLKIIKSPKPSLGLSLMYDAGVVAIVFPEMAQLAGVEQRQDHHHKDVFLHTLKVLDNIAVMTENTWLRIAALLHDIAKPRTKAFKEGIGWTFHGHEEVGARMVKSIFRRLRLPLEHVPYVEKLVRLHLRPMALVEEDVTDSAVRRLLFEAGHEIDDLMILCRADITSKNPRLVEQVKNNYDRVMAKLKDVEERDQMRNWQPPIRGEEIMALCNLQPGPLIGKLKQAVTDAILDGHIPNEHDAAVSYLLSIKATVVSTADHHMRHSD